MTERSQQVPETAARQSKTNLPPVPRKQAACCEPVEQVSCCAPSEKASCCGDAHAMACGCK